MTGARNQQQLITPVLFYFKLFPVAPGLPQPVKHIAGGTSYLSPRQTSLQCILPTYITSYLHVPERALTGAVCTVMHVGYKALSRALCWLVCSDLLQMQYECGMLIQLF